MCGLVKEYIKSYKKTQKDKKEGSRQLGKFNLSTS